MNCKYCSVDTERTTKMREEDCWYSDKNKIVDSENFKSGSIISDDWYDFIDLTNNRLVVDRDYLLYGIDLEFCPFCGRKLVQS